MKKLNLFIHCRISFTEIFKSLTFSQMHNEFYNFQNKSQVNFCNVNSMQMIQKRLYTTFTKGCAIEFGLIFETVFGIKLGCVILGSTVKYIATAFLYPISAFENHLKSRALFLKNFDVLFGFVSSRDIYFFPQK